MIFTSFTKFVDQINRDLGQFCNQFQYKRKQLNGNGRVAIRDSLFAQPEDGRTWAINAGGGTELQYHITIDNETKNIRYGLGFNTQYVPHANQMSIVEYMKPFMESFLSLDTELQVDFPAYRLFYGTYDDLIHPKDKQYVLWGKELPFIAHSHNHNEVDDRDYGEILTDLKIQFNAYTKIFSRRNEILNMGEAVQEYKELLKNKHQIILQGPPGTGKTYTAKDIAEEMIEGSISPTKEDQQKKLEASKRYKLIQFHPAYTYEDFVRGITVEANGSNVNYKAENRVLGAFAEEAAKPENKDKSYVLVIDEINRANLPAVLGELIYALEYRGHAVESMYKADGGDNKLVLPENLYIIGTMNTADRSVGHIDYAIRRRFAFKDLLPLRSVVEGHYKDDLDLKDKATKLFDAVGALFSNGSLAADFKAKDVQLGHSYFLADTEKDLELKLKYEIKPLLREYVKDGVLLEKASNCTTEDYINQLSMN